MATDQQAWQVLCFFLHFSPPVQIQWQALLFALLSLHTSLFHSGSALQEVLYSQ